MELQELLQEMQSVLQSATYPIDFLSTGKIGKLSIK
jgi:ABC-type branched-subunit amino acid transport system substrate-binding protein